MLRNIILIGAVIGVSVSVPMLYEANPGAFDAMLRREVAPASDGPIEVATARPERPDERLTGRKVSVPADASGHFRAEFRFNGRPVEGLLDTGATMIAINTSTARRLGLSVARSDYRHEVKTANGTTKGALARLDKVELGRIRVSDLDVLVLEDEALGGTLVGMNFMKELARFQVEGDSMVLEQ